MTTDALPQTCGTGSCCHETVKPFAHRHKHQEDSMEKAFRLVAKVSALALGVLAAVTEFWLFVPSFALGLLIGVFTYEKPVHSHGQHDHTGGGCSHGFLERHLGIKLPESVALVAGFAVFAVHVDHHPEVFVPIVGVSVGIWAGNLIAPSLIAGFRKFVAYVSPPDHAIQS